MPSLSVMRIDQLLMKTTFWHEHPRDDVKMRMKISSQFQVINIIVVCIKCAYDTVTHKIHLIRVFPKKQLEIA